MKIYFVGYCESPGYIDDCDLVFAFDKEDNAREFANRILGFVKEVSLNPDRSETIAYLSEFANLMTGRILNERAERALVELKDYLSKGE